MTRLKRLIQIDAVIGAVLAICIVIAAILATRQFISEEADADARAKVARKSEPTLFERRVLGYFRRVVYRGRTIWLEAIN